MSSIAENLLNVRRRIERAEKQYGRVQGSVTLVAVSKTKPVELIRQAIAQGQRVFGESYIQEAVEKILIINDPHLEWHFIGPIQSNKTRPLAAHFDWIHSVDRIKIAQRLNDQRPVDKAPINILLQVNISDEKSKAGTQATEVKTLIESILQMQKLKLRGLMAIPARTNEFAGQRAAFAKMALLLKELNSELGLSMDCLSMGMSNDLEAAIAEGATFVRIGTDIFGAREYLDEK